MADVHRVHLHRPVDKETEMDKKRGGRQREGDTCRNVPRPRTTMQSVIDSNNQSISQSILDF